jgi:fatty-acyl-CoA synthase
VDAPHNSQNALVPAPNDIERRTVVDVVWGHAQQQPHKLALIAASVDGTVKRLTYEELVHHAESVAAGLRDFDITAGDHIGIALSNVTAYEFVLTELACARLGAVAVLINPGSKHDELLHTLSLTACRLVVAGRNSALEIYKLTDQLPLLTVIVEVIPPDETCQVGWAELLTSMEPLAANHPRPNPSDDAYIIMTSGTTGLPKAVVLTHANGVAGGAAMVRAWDIRSDDIVQTPIPITTSAGTFVSRMGPLYAGATLIIDPPFDSEITFARIKAEGTTVVVAVPAIIIFMTEQFDAGHHSLNSIRLFCFGSAPITVATLTRVHTRFPWIQLGQIYGMTESSTVGAYLSPDVFDEHLGSIGKPVLCELRIVDDSDHDVPVGEEGQILIRGPSIMRGYYGDPEVTERTLAGGWLHTGDVGLVDASGFYHHVDRMKDIIVRGGYKIGSIEVENVLTHHPDVHEAAVIAIPHPQLGEDVFAFVVRRDNATVDVGELVDYCRERLVGYKVPRRISFISSLPRNLAGKIDKRALRYRAHTIVGDAAA